MSRCYHLSLLCVLLLLGACAGTQFSVPAIPHGADGQRLAGKVIWHDLVSDTPAASEAFFSGLFGWEFQSLSLTGANYSLIKHKGQLIGGMVDQTQLPTTADISQWIPVMSVANADAAKSAVLRGGGTVLTPPTSLGERGTIAVIEDPQGAVIALLETREGDPADVAGPVSVGSFLWNELWTSDASQASAFYRSLATLESESIAVPVAPDANYQLLSSLGRPRLGIRNTPAPEMPPLWLSYLRVVDESELEIALSKVEDLGGSILVPKLERPSGGYMAIIADPSGASIALQTWDQGAIGAASGANGEIVQ
ncbi:MAG: VOC family protein [Halioglobus sp.]